MNHPEQTQKIVMVFGTFDIFHAGHEHFLRQARELGDYLIVVISRDVTVKNVKGEYPQNSEKKRANNVKKTEIADKVVLGYNDDKYRVIKKFKPNVLALGYDQFVFTYKLNKMIIDENMDTEIIRLDPYKPGIYKSTLLKIQNEENQEIA